ncbi:hypothetical protein EYF80_055661 [Liparis tanakae]|uniref:Uncharacterized protein n=1 Tax=Liparis tanakae TaxID=230148 RepID=A0A4Z2EYY7_9TELE|nr:hypothetical protein EYF80_055661 [Liparis tanakae]
MTWQEEEMPHHAVMPVCARIAPQSVHQGSLESRHGTIISGRTGGLIVDVRQAGRDAGELGQPAVSEQLVDGGGLGPSPRGDHGQRAEQRTVAGADGAQDLTLELATDRLTGEEKTDK